VKNESPLQRLHAIVGESVAEGAESAHEPHLAEWDNWGNWNNQPSRIELRQALNSPAEEP
jgi:hypothetical protein